MRRRREPVEVSIDNLSHEGRGVGRINGKTVFVHGALPGERVRARILRRRARFDEAEVLEVLVPSGDRIAPRCASFGVCGGCSMQHVGEAYQLQHKQDVLIELLQHQAGITPRRIADPIRGPQWGYRRKARLGVKSVAKKGGVLVGFRERAKPYIADSARCEILDPRVGEHLLDLRALIENLSVSANVPQIEVALGDDRGALVVRHLEALSERDLDELRRFASESGLSIYLQSGGTDSIVSAGGQEPAMEYAVDGLTLGFAPTDFTQVNAAVNERMVMRALDYLALDRGDRVADLYCGIGNFSLPMARRAGQVRGAEGDQRLVERARKNALVNDLSNVEFEAADLARPDTIAGLGLNSATKVLLDPPRTGAMTLIEGGDFGAASRLVYVSCNPVTFARDAASLIGAHGFKLSETGILDMFPQTAHVESISLFERE
jgi:23S rRNA (uracil1939-C5)-methyltransferase